MELKELITKYRRKDPNAKSDEFFFGSPYDDKCPECGAISAVPYRCTIGSCVCENDHVFEWYRDRETGRAKAGNGHSK